jgi:uncharacterized protein YdhG (YjbR/CyaY superfamily)
MKTTPEVDAYMSALPEDRKEAMEKLRDICRKALPDAQECINYGMIGYVVPFSMYPDGYHCDTSLPLPFVGLASQKGHIGLYHMGVYAKPELLAWFQEEFPKHSKKKLDMGKSCIRFKKTEDIPYGFLETFMKKMSLKEWIEVYEKNYKR